MTDEHAPLEFRAAETLDVRYPERIVQVLAMPYERPTRRVVHEGRTITEVVSRGAFKGIEHRHNMRVLREHDRNKIAGKVEALHPERDEGLVAELRMSRSTLGQESLELAAEGLLDVSVGFAPMAGGERWSTNRSERRLERCYLDHIALVCDPAYEDAQVLSVRAAEVIAVVSTTPNRDAILAMLVDAGIQLRQHV